MALIVVINSQCQNGALIAPSTRLIGALRKMRSLIAHARRSLDSFPLRPQTSSLPRAKCTGFKCIQLHISWTRALFNLRLPIPFVNDLSGSGLDALLGTG